MEKKKSTDCVCEAECEATSSNKELRRLKVLKWRAKDFIDATLELVDVQESLILLEKRHESLKEIFDSTLKGLRDTMDGVSDNDQE